MARSVEVARLFVTLESETKGLLKGLEDAERSLGRTAKFILDHPVAAIAGIGTAAIAAGAFVTKMAAEVDEGVKRIGASIPAATKRLDELKQAARDLSVEFGISQTKVVEVMQDLARRGIDSVEGLLSASRAAVVAQKATGEDFGAIVAALDASLDAFGLSAEDSEKILARLFQTAQGKTSISELGAVLEKVGPIAHQSGISFDTLTGAAARLLDQGFTTKQIITELTKTINEQGVPAVDALAAQSRHAGDGLKAMHEQAEVMNTTAPALAAQLKERLNAVLIDLGAKILPVAVKGLEALNAELSGPTKSQFLTGIKANLEGLAASGFFTGEALTNLQGRIAKVTAELARLNPVIKDNKGALEGTTDAAVQLTDAQRRAIRASDELDASQKRVILTAKKLTDDQIKLVEKAVKESTKLATEAAKKSADALNEIRKIELDTARALLTAGNAEFVKLQEAFNEKMKDVRGKDAADAIAAFERVKVNFASKLAGINDDFAAHPLPIKRIEEDVRALEVGFDKVGPAAGKFTTKLDEQARKAQEAATKHELLREKIIDLSTAFGDGVDAAKRIFDAFGLLDDQSRLVFDSITGIADAVKQIGTGDILGGAATGLISLAGLVKGLFGDSPAAREARATLQKNTQRIEELNRTTGDLIDAQSSGRAIAGVQSGLGAFFNTPGKGIESKDVLKNLPGTLLASGVNLKDLAQIADDLQIDIKDSKGNFIIDGLRKLLDALRIADLAAPNTFKGRLGVLDTNLQTGITGKGGEFGGLLGALGGGNAIVDALTGISDIPGAGRAQAAAKLKQLLTDLNAGNITDKNALGDLSRPEFVAAIVRLLGILQSDQAIAGFDLPTTPNHPQVAFSESLDAAFGAQSPAVDYLSQIAANTAGFKPVNAPGLPAAAGAAAALGVSIVFGPGSIQITVGAGADPADVTTAAARGITEAIDQVLAQNVFKARQATGIATVLQ